MDTKKLYTGWANLVDLGFEFALANLKTKYGEKRALAELKESLSRRREEHYRDLIRMLKRLK